MLRLIQINNGREQVPDTVVLPKYGTGTFYYSVGLPLMLYSGAAVPLVQKPDYIAMSKCKNTDGEPLVAAFVGALPSGVRFEVDVKSGEDKADFVVGDKVEFYLASDTEADGYTSYEIFATAADSGTSVAVVEDINYYSDDNKLIVRLIAPESNA